MRRLPHYGGGATEPEVDDKGWSQSSTIGESPSTTSALKVAPNHIDFGISKELEAELVSAPIARRQAESKIITAQGQVEIAKCLGNRSKILDTKTAIQVRYLETLKGLARNAASRMLYRSF
ncbi:unnamed protein product [Sphagnum balticum]